MHKYRGPGNDDLVCHRAVAERLSNEQGRLQITCGADFQVCMQGPVHNIASLTVDQDCFVGEREALPGPAAKIGLSG